MRCSGDAARATGARAARALIFGGGITAVAAAPIGSYLGSIVGWRAVFLIAAALALLALALEVVGYNYQPHRYAYDQEHFPDRVICGTESYPHQAFVVWEAIGRTRLSTAGAAVALRLTPDRATISATASDLGYVTVEVVDAEGAVVRHATHQVTLDVSGVGKLLAIGTANPVSEELYLGMERAAYEGRLMAVVQSTGQADTIHIQAMAEALVPADLRLAAEEECGARR